MAKYSKGAQKSVEGAMKRMEKGKLKSGRSGKKVTDKKQAIAIGLSEARKKGAKVPVKKAAPKKATAKKAAPKKAAPKKAAAKKASPKKAVPKIAVAKKATPSKSKTVKAPSSNSAPKRSSAKKGIANDKRSTSAQISNEDNYAYNLPDEHTTDTEDAVVEKNNDIVNSVEDPVTSTDQKLYNKATSKADPKHNMAVSSIRKGGIKPSGKKPLW